MTAPDRSELASEDAGRCEARRGLPRRPGSSSAVDPRMCEGWAAGGRATQEHVCVLSTGLGAPGGRGCSHRCPPRPSRFVVRHHICLFLSLTAVHERLLWAGSEPGAQDGSEEKCRPCPAEQRTLALAGSTAMGVQSSGGPRGQHRPRSVPQDPWRLCSLIPRSICLLEQRGPPSLSPWFPERENISSPSTEPPERPGREACAGAGRWALNTHASVETASVGTPRARPAPPAQAVKAASRAALQQARTRVL